MKNTYITLLIFAAVFALNSAAFAQENETIDFQAASTDYYLKYSDNRSFCDTNLYAGYKAVTIKVRENYSKAIPDELLLAEIDSLIEMLPGCPHAYLIKARFFESLLRLDEAIATYNKLLEAHPENMKALIRLGVCYFHNDQTDKSSDTFKKMFAIYKNRWETSGGEDLISRCSMVTVEMMFRPKDAVLAEWNDFFENLDVPSRNFAGYYNHTITKFDKAVMMKLYSNKPASAE